MLAAIPPHLNVSEYMGRPKSKWCRGYYVDTVGKYETAIRNYIRSQLQDDIANDQIGRKEFLDPFTGEAVIIVWLSDFFNAHLSRVRRRRHGSDR